MSVVTYSPADGNDVCLSMGPAGQYGVDGCQLTHTQTTGAQWWAVRWGAQPPLFPQGLPQPVGSVYFINRQGACPN